jgi:hypothetical protein
MLIRATLLPSTVRTVDPGTTCNGEQDRAVPDVRSLVLDTGPDDMFPEPGDPWRNLPHCCTKVVGAQWDGWVTGDWRLVKPTVRAGTR